MIEENEEQKEGKINHTTENLESVGQMIIGGLETVGGILTGDPITRAEGEFNTQVGSLHQESNKVLSAIEKHEEHQPRDSDEANQTENK
jgi:hypothetical protein